MTLWLSHIGFAANINLLYFFRHGPFFLVFSKTTDLYIKYYLINRAWLSWLIQIEKRETNNLIRAFRPMGVDIDFNSSRSVHPCIPACNIISWNLEMNKLRIRSRWANCLVIIIIQTKQSAVIKFIGIGVLDWVTQFGSGDDSPGLIGWSHMERTGAI